MSTFYLAKYLSENYCIHCYKMTCNLHVSKVLLKLLVFSDIKCNGRNCRIVHSATDFAPCCTLVGSYLNQFSRNKNALGPRLTKNTK